MPDLPGFKFYWTTTVILGIFTFVSFTGLNFSASEDLNVRPLYILAF